MRRIFVDGEPVFDNVTTPPPSGLFCARDEHGQPTSESGRIQEATRQVPRPQQPASAFRRRKTQE